MRGVCLVVVAAACCPHSHPPAQLPVPHPVAPPAGVQPTAGPIGCPVAPLVVDWPPGVVNVARLAA